MADSALVQHSPWGGDGGAEETHYGWECLDFLLAAPDGTPQRRAIFALSELVRTRKARLATATRD